MTTRIAASGLCLLMLACGSDSGGEPPAQYLPRICAQEGPVQVLSFDEPDEFDWLISSRGDRWTIGRLLYDDDGVEPQTGYVGYLVGPCGEDPVEIDLWPFRVGDSTFGCDPEDGTLLRVDSRTGQPVSEISSGIECDPVFLLDDAGVLLDRSDGTLVLLDARGELSRTSIPAGKRITTQRPVAPYLNGGGFSGFGWIAPLDPQTFVVLAGDQTIWRLGTDGTSRLLFEGFSAAWAQLAHEVFVLQREGADEGGSTSTVVLDLVTAETWEGPPVEDLRAEGGYLFAADGLYHLRDRTLHGYPTGVTAQNIDGVSHEGHGYHMENRIVVWDVKSGAMLVDEAARGEACGDVWVEEQRTLAWWGDPRCERAELWSYPLQGGDPELIWVDDSSYAGLWVSAISQLVDWSRVSGQPDDLIYRNRESREAWTIDHGVLDLLRYPFFNPERGVKPADSMVLYQVRDGSRTGLWRSELPD